MKYSLLLFLFMFSPPKSIYSNAPMGLLEDLIGINQLVENGKLPEALEEYQKILTISLEKDFHNLSSLTYNRLGYISQMKGDYNKAKYYFQKGINAGKKSSVQTGVALNIAYLGELNNALTNNQNNLNHIKDALSLMKNNKKHDPFHEFVWAKLYTFLGTTKDSPDSLNANLQSTFKALEHYKKIPAEIFEKEAHLAIAHKNIAANYEKLKLYDSAIYELNKARKLINFSYRKQTTASIYTLYTSNYLNKEIYDSALYYGKKALELKDKQTEKEDIAKIYDYLVEASNKSGQLEQAEKYLRDSFEVKNELNKDKLKSVTKLYEENRRKSEAQSQKIKIGLFASLSIFVFFLCFIFYLNKKHKKEKQMFKEFRNSLEINRVNLNPISVQETISDKTESQILQKLENFEQKSLFTQKNITQGKLAAHLHTNVRYLSFIIKKHKSESFSSYINHLRINYIIYKIETDVQYRKYKISYLAQESGYPTCGSFTRAFKEITGIPPSSYITLLIQKESLQPAN